MWTIKIGSWLTPFRKIRTRMQCSERDFAEQVALSRMTLRQVERNEASVSVESIKKVTQGLEREVILLLCPTEVCWSEYSTLAVGYKVDRDGFDSWRIHYMEMVDEFRKDLDPRLLLLPPPLNLDFRLRALLASIVLSLCSEAEMDSPTWAMQSYYLDTPWFLSESESLKASALVESPVWFRKNNIFVLENFLRRA